MIQEQKIAKRVFVNPAYKDKVTVLKTSAETGGAYSLGELEVAPGGGNPMHTHDAFEETFTAISGVLGVVLHDKKYLLQPGESITVPINAPHHFFNSTNETVTCHVRFTPGHEDFVKGLAISYGLARDGATTKKGVPKSLTHLALLISLTNTKPTGLMGWLFPLFRSLAKKAKAKGIEGALLDKYYYE
ncbi:MAG: cupin domain-containing protein [Chitinophagaceae bacterium]|nr:cupin domain-containing protein [Chitinophagaceae bacterium]